eukprot:752363-Hanusia_phi.AAC.2
MGSKLSQVLESSGSHHRALDNQGDLNDVRECGEPKSTTESSLKHVKEEHINICKHKEKLYRCTKIDGNSLANDRFDILKESCLGHDLSAKECEAGERLCELTSPSSFSQFSSPEPCTFEYKHGFVPDDPQQDIFIAEMTWEQARDWCNRHDLCAAFTFGLGIESSPLAFVDRLLEATPYRVGNDRDRTLQRLQKESALSRLKSKSRGADDETQISSWEDAYKLIKEVLTKKGISRNEKEIKALATHLWQSISSQNISLDDDDSEHNAASFEAGQA